jgi:DNA polymerase-3 subunit delta'
MIVTSGYCRVNDERWTRRKTVTYSPYMSIGCFWLSETLPSATIHPMNWDLLGQDWAVELLGEHVAKGKLRHAYLFTGPQGVGRRTLALRLAQAINCPQPPAPGEPCRACRTCTQIERMQHPDLSIVQADTQGGTLKVEQVRELQRSLALTPYSARYRVAILLRFEEAHPSAANALLKTLEEPPPQVVLIVTAESAEALLPTIVSRCEVLRLRPSTVEEVRQRLQTRWGLLPEQASLLAHISGGRVGYALHLNEAPERLEQRRSWLDDHRRMLAASRVERFAYADGIAKDKELLRQALNTWVSFWRDVLLCSAGASAPLTNPDCEAEIRTLAERIGLQDALRMVSAIEHTLDLLDHNVNTRLATEVLMLDLPRMP